MELKIQNVSMTYPSGKQALKGLNLDLKSPSLIGLLGPNGAGKSTLMKLLVAALMPTEGSILVDGAPLNKVEGKLKASLGYLPQDFGLFEELTVTQFLDYMAALKGLRSPQAAIRDVIRAVNLEEKARAKIRTLSGGQRQRVGIAQALLGDPPFLIFDEPTVGLDPEERIHFRNLFSRTAQDRLVLLSTHIIEDVQSVCDRLVVINHGQIRFTGTPEQLIASAAGHVGVFWEKDETQEQGLHITARVNTSQGVRCRAVADQLPPYAQAEEPTPMSSGRNRLWRTPTSISSPGRRHNEDDAAFPIRTAAAAPEPPDLADHGADGPLPGVGAGALHARHIHHHALHVFG